MLNLSVVNRDVDPEGRFALPTFADFLAATPEERRQYLAERAGNDTGVDAGRAYGLELRNITLDGGNKPLSSDQYSFILKNSNLDPDLQQQAARGLGEELDFQARTAADNSLTRNALVGFAAFAGFGGGIEALGFGTSSSTAAAVESSAVAESFVGPATGSIEAAPTIGASGAPTVSAVASGGGAFVPTTFGSGVAEAFSSSLNAAPTAVKYAAAAAPLFSKKKRACRSRRAAGG
jgi:hypothetical protein